MNKASKDLVRWAAQRGWAAETTRGGHVRLTRPGHRDVIVPATTGRGRSLQNSQAEIKRAERDALELKKENP